MSAYWTHTRVDSFGAAVAISGANASALVAGQPWDVKRIVAVISTATTGASPSEITVQKIPLPTGTSDPVELGKFVIPSGLAAGTVVYFDLADPSVPLGTDLSGTGSTIGADKTFAATPDLGKIDVGEQLRVLSNGGADAGGAIFYAEYAYQGNTGDRFGATKAARAA
jgi:hypothetical protein